MKRKVIIFGRSIPIAGIMAALIVVVAFAWVAWMVIVGSGSFEILYAPTPQEILTTITGEQCNVISGAGVPGAPVVVTEPYSITCPFTAVDDTSVIQTRFSLDNSASLVPVTYTVTGPVTSCFDVFADPVTRVLAAGAPEDIMRITLTGNGETLACAIASQTESIVFDFTLGE